MGTVGSFIGVGFMVEGIVGTATFGPNVVGAVATGLSVVLLGDFVPTKGGKLGAFVTGVMTGELVGGFAGAVVTGAGVTGAAEGGTVGFFEGDDVVGSIVGFFVGDADGCVVTGVNGVGLDVAGFLVGTPSSIA